MEEIIKKIPDVKIAADVIANLLRELGGDGTGDNIAHAYVYLNEGGFRLSANGANGTIYYTEGADARFSYQERGAND